jgi:Sulfotransferase domain
MKPMPATGTLAMIARDLARTVRPGGNAFLLSYPKCGRTWLELMISHAMHLEFGGDVRLVEHDLLRTRNRLSAGPAIVATHDLSATTREDGDASKTIGPQLIGRLPLRFRFWGRKILMLIRDPRDTVVSSFHQNTKRTLSPLPFADIDAYALDPTYGLRRILKFYKIWDLNRHLAGAFKIVRYEDLQTDTATTLAACLAFFGLDIDAERVTEICAAYDLEAVRALERRQAAGLRFFPGDDAMKARKGEIASYRRELKPDTIAILNRWMGDMPKAFAYPVDQDSPMSSAIEGGGAA